MSHVREPNSVEELCQLVHDSDFVLTESTSSRNASSPQIEVSGNVVFVKRNRLDKLIDVQSQNQTITVEAGMKLSELKQHLYEHQQVLPVRFSDLFAKPVKLDSNHLYQLIENNFPHTLVGQHGSWRDWILEAKIILADGTAVKSGAKVVKSVTGYDLHKLIVGSRATLGILVEVTLRTLPTLSLQSPNVESVEGELTPYPYYRYQRVCQSDWDSLALWIRTNCKYYSLDHAAHQAFFPIKPGSETPRFIGEISWDWHYGVSETIPPDVAKLMHCAKQVFDPRNKLNPGAFDFL